MGFTAISWGRHNHMVMVVGNSLHDRHGMCLSIEYSTFERHGSNGVVISRTANGNGNVWLLLLSHNHVIMSYLDWFTSSTEIHSSCMQLVAYMFFFSMFVPCRNRSSM
jgi:hypothetical protein